MGWGEDYDDMDGIEAEPIDVDAAAIDDGDETAALVAAMSQDVIGQVAAQQVAAAVNAAVRTRVDELADHAVSTVLTNDVLQELITRAHNQAVSAIKQNPAGAAATAAADRTDTDEGEAPSLVYGSVDEFVRKYLRYAYKRTINASSTVWAARWWEYDEAVIRLEAIWRAWEHLRLDPATGMSVWWRDHADHHMAILLSPTGPFGGAGDDKSRAGEPLPYTAPPAGMFPDVRDQPTTITTKRGA